MGFWQCKDGTKVELIFNEKGEFIKFGEGTKENDKKKVETEISDFAKEQNKL